MRAERPILEVDGVVKSFGGRRVLTSAGFSARRGRITALMGRNGSGKTTMLRVAVGRVRPEQGRVLYEGEPVHRPTLHRLARAGVMYSAQESALTALFTIGEHLRTYQTVYGSGAERLDEIVGLLELAEILPRRPARTSGGERQRASLGLALLRAPACLLMDEPFAGVAPRDRPLISAGLASLRAQGAAVVLSGHDVEDVLDVADEVVWVVAGTTHVLGSPDEARRHDQFRREYLGPRIESHGRKEAG
jgi:ABC-type multidrug transport system ATPase subunit